MPARAKASARRVHLSESIQLPEQREFRAAIVADTHSRPHPNTRNVIESLTPDLILHAGDIGDLAVLDTLRELGPVLAVRGNIDATTPGLADSIDVELRAGERRVLNFLLLHIAVYGPKLRAEVARLAQSHASRLVVCGHSHVPFLGKDKGIVMFNPGSIGPRRFNLPITLGLLQVGSAGISLRHISCETGETWLPPA